MKRVAMRRDAIIVREEVSGRFFGRGVYPELYQILRYAQNDSKRRAPSE